MPLSHKPLVLIILDGWGYSENTVYNAIYSAHKPVWEKIWSEYPKTLIRASGTDVGLPPGQMGNSEVGHMNIGSGRIVDQEFSRITRAINNGSFFKNETLVSTFKQAAAAGKAVHLLGLLSPGGVHSHQDHIYSLMQLADQCGVEDIYIHAFLDGRDTPPKSAEEYIHQTYLKIRQLGKGKFASVIGRYYAMDRNKHWDRTKAAYDLICDGTADFRSDDVFIAVDMAYARGETDEFVSPTSITRAGEPPIRVEDGDVIVFANYRADRARQLARAFTKPDFMSFERERVPELGAFISLTEYKANYEFPVAFPPEHLKNVFGEYIANHGLKQLRIAETEKYAHVTFFFNGGEERVFKGEDRILVPSPHVTRYNQKPEMSALEVTDRLVESITGRKYDAIICNYANADMVGHTGDFQATIKAIQAIDKCLGKVIEAVTRVGGEILITADHGNAEQMRAFTTEKIKSQAHTAHTGNLIPLIYIGRQAEFLPDGGVLSDIAPTMLYLMGLPIPKEMTGTPLLKLDEEPEQAIVAK
ncbi:MAG TPA: 2,3-bisphosphoglycerate-independent phosphoglycerate mutase [Gammaproteobacteria bacterium]|nr:2,3-bisphosphoglycerate-independent phosphoglycerate mutase [Gammaproteobacteria bacterium]